MTEKCIAPAPLFIDPIHDGAADPAIIWNREEKAWWIVYTNRRANVSTPGVAWAHGTDIGIASSDDGGKNWVYRGVLALNHVRGRNTFWAPEIIFSDGLYHLYVSFVRGVPCCWGGKRSILHYESPDLWDWTFVSQLRLSSERVIDPCVSTMPNGRWMMCYKDEADSARIHYAISSDLYDWKPAGAIVDDIGQEGPNVFFWQDKYWLITDNWSGLGVYVSTDSINWSRQVGILGEPGLRKQDTSAAHHADVLVNKGEAFIFYFTHPGLCRTETLDVYQSGEYEIKRSSLQVAKLEVNDGTLVCSRNKAFNFELAEPDC